MSCCCHTIGGTCAGDLPSASPWAPVGRDCCSRVLSRALWLATMGGAAGWIVGHSSSGLLASAFLVTTRDRLPDVIPLMRARSSSHRLCALTTALLCGLLPATRTARADAAGGGLAGERTNVRCVPLGDARGGMRSTLAVVVVFAAALLGRSLGQLRQDRSRLRHRSLRVRVIQPGGEPLRRRSGFGTRHTARGYGDGRFQVLKSAAVSTLRPARRLLVQQFATCWTATQARGEVDLDENRVGPGYFATTADRGDRPAVSSTDRDQRRWGAASRS